MAEEKTQQEEPGQQEEEIKETPAQAEQTNQIIEQANAAAERLEKANKVHAKLLHQQQAMQVEKTFGGTADAGTPSISKEDKEIAEAKKLLAGTGLEDYAFPSK